LSRSLANGNMFTITSRT